MKKRPSIRGRGADIFFAHPGEPHSSLDAPERQPPRAEKRKLASFWLTPQLIEKLDDAWIERRKTERTLQKSFIVEEALRAYLG
jgi:hypothetical protein